MMRKIFKELNIEKTEYTLKFAQRKIVYKYSKDDLIILLKTRSTGELAKHLGIDYNTLIPILNYYKIPFKNRKLEIIENKIFEKYSLQQLKELLKVKSKSSLASELGIMRRTLEKILDKHNIPHRKKELPNI